MGAGTPGVSLHWQADTLVWNARGQGPFKLTVGEVQTAALASPPNNDITQLLPNLPNDTAISSEQRIANLPQATVGAAVQAIAVMAAPRAVAKPVSEPTLRWWLWGGLGLGVLLLGAMAYSLFKQNNAEQG